MGFYSLGKFRIIGMIMITGHDGVCGWHIVMVVSRSAAANSLPEGRGLAYWSSAGF